MEIYGVNVIAASVLQVRGQPVQHVHQFLVQQTIIGGFVLAVHNIFKDKKLISR